MSFSQWMKEGDLTSIQEKASEIMDEKVKVVLHEKINNSKRNIGRRLASQAIKAK